MTTSSFQDNISRHLPAPRPARPRPRPPDRRAGPGATRSIPVVGRAPARGTSVSRLSCRGTKPI
ncbi:hypothetical protein JYU34_017006 [Plutella xylostella]|uniref:Uncharacterized protein n=1 Tax=Plutella xylostella TaxID=51655 RepID=A0ABQ7Q508_PLUXY|nr:hypothetical protein JYU34_017006 [Plutella xylostella]